MDAASINFYYILHFYHADLSFIFQTGSQWLLQTFQFMIYKIACIFLYNYVLSIVL